MTQRSKLTSDVANFMHQAGQAMPETPTVPDDTVVRLRYGLTAEEFVELGEAMFDVTDVPTLESIHHLKYAIHRLRHYGKLRVDLVEAADALADIEFVTRGTSLAFGVDPDAVADEVARSNASKFPAVVDEHGKVRKPPHYSPPDIAGVLARQGWQP